MAWRGSKLIGTLFILIVSFSNDLNSQEIENQSIDSLWWKEKTSQLDYTEEEAKSREMREGPDLSWLYSPFVKYTILSIIVAGLLILLFYLFRNDFFKNGDGEREKDYKLLIEEDLDNHFYEMDLDQILQESIANSQWKLAIRIRFLMLLRSLIDEGKLDWHKDLTNHQIIYQIIDVDKRKAFTEIVIFFEQIWYGKHQSSNDKFDFFDQRVESFIQSIKERGSDE